MVTSAGKGSGACVTVGYSLTQGFDRAPNQATLDNGEPDNFNIFYDTYPSTIPGTATVNGGTWMATTWQRLPAWHQTYTLSDADGHLLVFSGIIFVDVAGPIPAGFSPSTFAVTGGTGKFAKGKTATITWNDDATREVEVC